MPHNFIFKQTIRQNLPAANIVNDQVSFSIDGFLFGYLSEISCPYIEKDIKRIGINKLRGVLIPFLTMHIERTFLQAVAFMAESILVSQFPRCCKVRPPHHQSGQRNLLSSRAFYEAFL